MEIKLDPETVSTLASDAIFKALTQEQRDQVLMQAVQSLLTPEPSRAYSIGSSKTPLQKAFDQAIQNAAYKAVQEKIAEDPEVKKAIDDLLGPLIKGALVGEASLHEYGLAGKIGEAIGQWLGQQARRGDG